MFHISGYHIFGNQQPNGLCPKHKPDFLVCPTSLPSCLTIFIGYHSLLGFNSRFSHRFTARTFQVLRDLIRLPSSAISLHPLRSLDRHDLFVPWARTYMAQTRTFVIIVPALWNQFHPSTRSTLLTGEPSASFHSLKTVLFSFGLSHWKRFWLVCTARSDI